MNTLEMIREEAGKVYTDSVQLDAFMEGFEKQAGLDMLGGGVMTRLFNNEAVRGAMAKAGVGLAAGLAGALLVKGVTSTSSAITNNALKSKFESALQQVINSNKIVKGANPTRVNSYAMTLFNFAPHVASDPNILSSLLSNAVLGEGLDPMTIKSVTDLEGRYKENAAPGPLLGIRT